MCNSQEGKPSVYTHEYIIYANKNIFGYTIAKWQSGRTINSKVRDPGAGFHFHIPMVLANLGI